MKIKDKVVEPIDLVDVTGGMTPEEIGGAVGGVYSSTLSPFSAAISKLNAGFEPAVFTLVGDSTGNSDDEWFNYALLQYADKKPNKNIVTYGWDNDINSFTAPRFLSKSSGGEAFVRMTVAESQNILLAHDSGNLNLDGDLDFRMKISIDDWSVFSSDGVVSGVYQTGQRAWALKGDADKTLYLSWSIDGTAVSGGVAYKTPVLPVSDGDVFYFRVTLDIDNGAGGHTVTYYLSTDDGETWNQLSQVVNSGTTSIFNGTSGLYINGRGVSAWDMTFYSAELLDGIDGPLLASPNAAFYGASPANDPFTDVNGNSVDFRGTRIARGGDNTLVALNGSAPGKALAYSSGVSIFNTQFAKEPDVAIISYSHNEGATFNYTADYSSFISQIEAAWPLTRIVPSTQNPKKSPSSDIDIENHAVRNYQVAKLASKNNLFYIDGYRAFTRVGDYDSFINADGVHPEPNGSMLWGGVLLSMMMMCE